ncbi:FAD-binding and (Fe-S)-binding domain-containing protein [Streptacidiphilus melanogenes]|uniref:FAD-binding and (Fe-S)-binding domain-containing protein n=1 Tax=Streptacidiphilus melanogenes TaxID=411235 RepID=UPI0005A78D3D|nr:FAD-binding and (Fe-S)-binding domain-containing protein [Streptacidiphilus melanogenes]
MPTQNGVNLAGLEHTLREEVDGEVRFDAGSRGAYATDGSNYRQVPLGVVVPRTVEAGARAVAVCSRFAAPVLSRGGGTSLGGQCTNDAVVLDWTKYCDHLVSVDPEARTCVVEPGIVLDELNRQLAVHGLMFGPQPSTHSHCALGGMIGNNSCGASAQAYGKTCDNIRRLEVLTYEGTRFWAGATSDDEHTRIVAEGGPRARMYQGLKEIVGRNLADIRRGYPKIPRRVSGYNLDWLLPENGFHLARALVGSEGTLVTVLQAELDLVPVPAAQALLVLGFDDIYAAADTVPTLLKHARPAQLEALDGRMAQLMREEHAFLDSLEQLPKGDAWLLVQFTGDSKEQADQQARDLLQSLGLSEEDPSVAFSDDPEREQEMLKAREAGLGVTARPPDGRETWEGWEDSAVAPEKLGAYLRDLEKLFQRYGYQQASLYGHFGQGCVHTRIPFELRDGKGIEAFRAFLFDAADLVSSYGGSLSGEHGDGQARGELLPHMFGQPLIDAMGEVKALFDPGDRMNPGKVVHPHRVDQNLRLGENWRPEPQPTHFAYPDDDHDFTRAVMRCVGVGNCRTHEGGVMCPSYRATGEEEHSTRGRARLLFEMLGGHADTPIRDGWRSTEVRDALDLCLACKGCKSDCPVGVDMATYKAEFLAHHYQGRIRPRTHYAMGWLPLWARLTQIAPGIANAALHAPLLAGLGKRLACVAPDRDAPLFAAKTFQESWQAITRNTPEPADPRTVVLWPDTFTNHFHPHIGQAAARVLENAGFHVAVPDASVCCGLTWISTGQLDTATRILRRTTAALRPWLEAGTPIVVLEPSCAAVFRSDAPELMPGDQDIARLAAQTRTFAEQLVNHSPEGWQPPRLSRAATVQTHCHQHAVLGADPDRELMRRAGIDADVLDAGCCGLAGNFGFEQGHHDLSLRIAEQGVLPAVRDTAPSAFVLADGFSCRTQIDQGATGRSALHLAEALAMALDGPPPSDHPEKAAPRPEPRPMAGRLLTAGVAAATASAAAVGLAAQHRARTRRSTR